MRSHRFEAVLKARDGLASTMVQWLGADFAERFPPRAHPDKVREELMSEGERALGDGTVLWGVWLAWAAITQAEHLFRDPRAEQAAKKKPCPDCQGTGKRKLEERRENGEKAVKTKLAKVEAQRLVLCDLCAGAGKVPDDDA